MAEPRALSAAPAPGEPSPAGGLVVGRRVLVLGPGGAGKTTLSRRLAALLDVPVLHLDAVVGSAAEDAKVTAWLERRQGWVIDGNHLPTLPLRASAADTAIYLELPPVLCVARVVRRAVKARRPLRRPDTAEPDLAPGRRHRARLRFLWHVLRFHRTHGRLARDLVDRTGLPVLVLRSCPSVEQALRAVAANAAAGQPAPTAPAPARERARAQTP